MPHERPGRRSGSRHRRTAHGHGGVADPRGAPLPQSTADFDAIELDIPETLGERFSRVTGLDETRVLAGTPGGRWLVGAIALIAVATVVGLATMWPRGDGPVAAPGTKTVGAEVTAVADDACPGAEATADGAPVQQCRTITVDPDGDLEPGEISIGPAEGASAFARGDRVRVAEIPDPPTADAGADIDALGGDGAFAGGGYSLVGQDHTSRLIVAAVLLGLLALAALRVRGLLALLGVGLSLLLLTGFLVPAILAGHPPLLVALVGALAVMFVTLTLTNGFGAQTLAGALGIALTLTFTTVVGLVAVRYTGLDGTGSELSIVLAQAQPGVSLEGILLAGMVIGGLGVLADTAVTQASAVMALRRTDPSLRARSLYAHAVVVGRDHLAATIHTLVLAYAGTVLPLLLVLHAGATSTADTVNQVDIAEPILATIVGCAGLIVAVPLTTALAAVLVARIPPSALPAGGGHGHHH